MNIISDYIQGQKLSPRKTLPYYPAIIPHLLVSLCV